MKLSREFIEANKGFYPWLDELYVVISSIEKNLLQHPDIAIESCKALLESIANTTLQILDSTYVKDESIEVHKLLKKAKDKLLSFDVEAEESILTKATSLLHGIAEIRNKRGDISHGRALPKELRSSIQLAKLIKSTTDGVAAYFLYLLCEVMNLDTEIQYEDNPKFNEYLDDSLDVGDITSQSPSYILFAIDPISYFDRLELYLSENH